MRESMRDPAKLEEHQASRFASVAQAHREAVLRQALAMLDGHIDDWIQPYPEILRRLQAALERERETTAP